MVQILFDFMLSLYRAWSPFARSLTSSADRSFMRPKRPPFPSGWSSISISPADLSIVNTLPVGQSFLWHRHLVPNEGPSKDTSPVEEYARAIDGRVVCLRQSSTNLYYTAVHPTEAATAEDLQKGSTRQWLEDYFQLNSYPNLVAMYSEWRKRDPELFGMAELDGRAIGVRLLRQDPWECLIA